MAVVEMIDPSYLWYTKVLDEHLDEALERTVELLGATSTDANGCLVTPTLTPRKVRFRGGQDRAYRFAYCVAKRYPAMSAEVVRHQCHNRLCINPDHLLLGSKWDNKQDDYRFAGNGVDFDLL